MNAQMPPESAFMPLSTVEAQQQRMQHRQRPRPVDSGQSFGIHDLDHRDGLIEPTAWHGKPVPRRQWVVENLIPRGEVTMLTGNGGEGKSLLTMQLLAATCLRTRWLNRIVPQIKSLGIYCEDDHDELMRRADSIVRHHGKDFADLDGLTLVSRKGKDSTMYEASFNDMVGRTTPFYERVRRTCLSLGVELLIVDSLYNFFGGNENSRPQANQFINHLAQIAQDINGGVVLVAHPSQSGMGSGSGTAGSTAWHNAVRSRLYLHRKKVEQWELDKDPHKKGDLILQPMKANYAAPEDAIPLVWERGCFVPIVTHTGPMPDYFDGSNDR